MAESTLNGVRHRRYSGVEILFSEIRWKYKRVWFQDEFSREKVKLSERAN